MWRNNSFDITTKMSVLCYRDIYWSEHANQLTLALKTSFSKWCKAPVLAVQMLADHSPSSPASCMVNWTNKLTVATVVDVLTEYI